MRFYEWFSWGSGEKFRFSLVVVLWGVFNLKFM